jgi:predicted metalloprotease with PDZ domain
MNAAMAACTRLVAAATVWSALAAAALPAQAIRYTVEPVRNDTGLDLRVSMTFPGDSSGRTELLLPRDRFGVPRMHRFVHDVLVLPPARLLARDEDTLRIGHASRADISVRYTIRYDSAQAGFVAYGPSVDSRHYHFLGSQWMARVGPADSVRQFVVRVDPGNLGGTVAGSFGIAPGEHELTSSYEDIDWTVIAGGAYREDRFSCAGKPVATLLYGPLQVPDDSIFALSRAIICGEREIFADTVQPFYTAIVIARENLRAGASFINAFSSFVWPDSRRDQIALLLAHEMMHAWLPRRLRLVPGPGEAASVDFSSFHDIRYDWFHEGFTEYLARRVLVRKGIASEDWFVTRLNADLRQLATHPYRTLPAAGLEEAARTRRYTNAHQRLSYYRGAVLAFNWDAAVRRASGGEAELVDVIRRLLAEAAVHDGRIPRPRFEEVVASFGIAAQDDVARYALGGETIPADSAGLGRAGY